MESSEKDNKINSLGQRLKRLAAKISNTSNRLNIKGNTIDKQTEGQYLEDDNVDNMDDAKFDFDDLYEMARVEGYDDSSYIMSSLKDIDRKLSNNDTSSALKVINELITDVMPFDYPLFFELYKATEDTASRLSDKDCWVLLGPTGAGKSTSVHFLCGSEFKSAGKQGNVIVHGMHKSLADKDIKVGESVTESETRYIAEVLLDLKELGIKCGPGQPKQILCVDSPGFEDTAGPEVDLANGIGTIRALKRAKSIKIIITFKEAHLDSKFKTIRSIANSMSKAMKDLENQLNKPHGSPISGFLTKSNHGVDAAKETFNQAYDEQEEKNSDSNANAVFKALLYKLGKRGPLNEIKIDLQNPQNNDIRRRNIIESLVKQSGYIEASNESFNEFISEPTLGKLKEQIERDFSTIQNILSHDQYFENPLYIQYIIDILESIDTLKDVIKNAGGKYVESKLKDCLDIFKTKLIENLKESEGKILSQHKTLIGIDYDKIRKTFNKIKTKYDRLVTRNLRGSNAATNFGQLKSEKIPTLVTAVKTIAEKACYSELLSKRDETAFNELFMIFGVQNHIHYQTFNNIFEQVINDDGDIRETTKKIVLARNIDNADDVKIDEKEEQRRLLKKRQKILFIDEVDKFFSTDFFGKQYTPSCVIPNSEIFDKNLDLKGMHVYLTYWPETLAEEIQIKGRTARQGQRGSFHIILNENAKHRDTFVLKQQYTSNSHLLEKRKRKSSTHQKVAKNVKTYRNNKKKYKYHRW